MYGLREWGYLTQQFGSTTEPGPNVCSE